ncbi:MAG TPA: hypothetical protein VHX44_08760, partial [Planctomycetota bacterium]|nr:hypothetical protein [Planctomycetota bacterium]
MLLLATAAAASAEKVSNENQQEEADRFKAYFLPVSEKAHIQEALGAHGSVRLGIGDYTGVSIRMRSHQKLYGHPSLSSVSGITIAAGSSDVVLTDLTVLGNGEINFEAGDPITNCLVKSIRNPSLIAKGAKIEGCTIMNIWSCRIEFDFSSSGYYRNNRLIKMQGGCNIDGTSGFLFKGNSATPSFGNVHMWTNVLMPRGDGMVLDNLQSATFVGLDGEMWNSENKSVGKK